MKNILWYSGHKVTIPDVSKAEGCYIYDNAGNRFLDLESGVWCTSLGHNHPEVNNTIKEQIDIITHSGYCYSHKIVQTASEKILNLVGFQNGKCVYLSSGTEAVELGVQVLRAISNKPKLLTMSDSFLGSYGSAGTRKNYEWYLFDWSVCCKCSRSNNCDINCRHIKSIPLETIGGFVFEPGSSGGSVNFPPESMISNIVKLIKIHNGYIQVNEITTGIGRTGKWFGYQHYNLKPDLVSMGKGLGNGYPVSTVAISSILVKKIENSSFHWSQSHQNDPLWCAVANCVVSTILNEHLIEHSKVIGDYLFKKLVQLKEKHISIKEIRGRGLMLAIEFKDEVDEKIIIDIHSSLKDKGILVVKRQNLNVFRLDPPLILSKSDVDFFIDNFDNILNTSI
ncbi:MAG TPA: aspartate aminotransferase family protein [Victivallales bacterium]|nr:aspartate aminotransferase family protein [Victivallales bacterium]